MKNDIRPLYYELQGYLSQSPSFDNKNEPILYEESMWGQFHTTINELNQTTGKNYDKFKITPLRGDFGPFVRISEYRSKLGGLISRLHGEYFNDEPAPFSGMPNTIIQQNQQQTQSTQIQILLEIQSIIDKNLEKTVDPIEKSFLEKIKSSLSLAKSVPELMSLILSTGSSLGMTIDQVLKFFK